jgi:chitin disaccharide deacetylase
MPQLIVNADDYGLTAGINAAIQSLFEQRALTSATLMAAAPQADAAIAFAKSNPGFGVGCHIVLLDGDPVAPPSEVASLLRPGHTGFYPTLGEFLRALFAGRIRPEHIEREAAAQLTRLANSGIQPTHVDTHKHTHMFPDVLNPLLRAAKSAGVRAIRNPFEPAWSVAATKSAPRLRKTEVSVLRGLYGNRFRQCVQQSELASTDGTLGIAATGSLDVATLRDILQVMPEGTWELVCHPGHVDDALQQATTRLRESREIEFASLQGIASLLPQNTTLKNYGDLAS